MLKLPFFNNMVHFPSTLKPIYNNLSIEKDKASFTYQTQDDGVDGISDTDNEVPDIIPPVRIVHPAEGMISS